MKAMCQARKGEETMVENAGKIGLVVEGGGMKCAYNAAILDAFLDEGIALPYCVGVSAGAGNLASYLAGQRGRNLRFFTEHIHNPRYFGLRSFLRTGDLFGLQFIYGELTRTAGKDPLDFVAMQRNPAQYEAVVTNARTGEAAYFGREHMRQDDYRLIMASSALPAICRPVELEGTPYYDGGLADAIPARRALAQGCDRTVVLLSKNRDYVRKPQGMRPFYALACRRYPRIVEAIRRRHTVYNANLQDVFALEREGRAFVLAPSQPLRIGTLSMAEAAERELYDLGLADFAARRDELQRFLAG